MKKPINIRLEENIIIKLEQLSKNLHTTKTDIIERAIKLFANYKNTKDNNLIKFAGILDKKEAKNILDSIE